MSLLLAPILQFLLPLLLLFLYPLRIFPPRLALHLLVSPPGDAVALEEAAAAYDSRAQPLPPDLHSPPTSSSGAIPPSHLQAAIDRICSALDSVLTKVSSLTPPQPIQAYPALLRPKSRHPIITRSRDHHQTPARDDGAPSSSSGGSAPAPLPSPQGQNPTETQGQGVTAEQELGTESEGSEDEGPIVSVIHTPHHPNPPRGEPPARPRGRGPGAVYQEDIEIQELDQTSLKEVRKAVLDYGPLAPYTLSCLESLSFGGNLYPIEWRITVRRCFKPPEIMLWNAEFRNNCKELSLQNKRRYLQMSGLKPFDTLKAQKQIPYDILNCTSQAALKA